MGPAEVGKRVSLANEALLNVGARTVLGLTISSNEVEYLESEDVIYEFRPLERGDDSDVN